MEKRIQSRLTVIAGLLVLILGIFIVKENLSQFSSPPTIEKQFRMSKNEINRVDINYKNKNVSLTKNQSTWMVTKPKKGIADQERVDTTITELLSLKKDTIISTNKSKQKSLGIGNDSIILYTSSNKMEMHIGTTELGTTNVTFGNDTNTYAVTDISDTINPIEYRDLTVPVITKVEDVTAIDISYSGNDIRLTKEKDNWTANEIPAKNDRVVSLLNDMKSLTASDIEPLSNQTIDPSISIQVKEQSKVKTLSFFDTGDTYYLIITGNKNRYTINKIYADSFKKNLSDLTE
jgi:hypothetical protein